MTEELLKEGMDGETETTNEVSLVDESTLYQRKNGKPYYCHQES